MKQFFSVVAVLVCALLVVGCGNKGKDTELVTTGGAPGATGTAGSVEPGSGETSGTIGGMATLPGATGTTGTTGSTSVPGLTPGDVGTGSGIAPTDNPSINSSGEMIKQGEGVPPPPGRVWCDNCKGHLPKEDAVNSGGKSYCMACAEELKIKK